MEDLLGRVWNSIRAVEYYNDSNGTKLTPNIHPVSLITYGADGYPSARTIAPLEIAADLSEFRFYTRQDSRKVKDIQRNPKVSLAWQDQRGRGGWVTIKGDAELRPGKSKTFPVDIIVMARVIEAVSYNEGLLQDDGTGERPIVLERERGTRNGWRKL